LHGGDRRALQRGQEHAAQCIAERQPEAALERLGDGGGDALGIVAVLDRELLRLDQGLPILLNYHGSDLMTKARSTRYHSRRTPALRPAVPSRVAAPSIARRKPIFARPRRATQTRRRLGGRQPLCGIGVTSRIEVTAKPTACNARNADSRPEPGPLTSISSVRMPCSIAFLPASSAATWAA